MALKTEILVKEEELFLQGKLTSSKKLSEEKHIYRQDLAEDFGYTSEQWVQGFYVDQNWYDVSDGDSILVATSNDEFFNHYFGGAVASFNERELEKLGMQKEIRIDRK